MTDRPVLFLEQAFLAFWAVWLTVALATNVLDAGKPLGLLGEGWAFASGNYRLLVVTTSRYGTPAWVNGLLFAGVIAWEVACMGPWRPGSSPTPSARCWHGFWP